jgi:hypothetical protein
MNEAEEARGRERAEGNAGGVRVERRVRPPRKAHVICVLLEKVVFAHRKKRRRKKATFE